MKIALTFYHIQVDLCREKGSKMQYYYLLMQHKLSISKLQIQSLQN
jgi:hypothetical protein